MKLIAEALNTEGAEIAESADKKREFQWQQS